MQQSQRLVLAVALFTSLAAAPAWAEEGDNGEGGPWEPPVCQATGTVCEDIGELYEGLYELANTDPSWGIPGLVEAILELRPNSGGAWVLQRETVEAADTQPEVDPGALVQVSRPGPAAMPVLVVPRPDNPPSPDLESMLGPTVDDHDPDGALRALDDAVAALPVDPREDVAELLRAIATVQLPSLPEPEPSLVPAAPAPVGEPLREEVPGWRADLAAPALPLVRNEILHSEAYRLAAPTYPPDAAAGAAAEPDAFAVATAALAHGPGRDLIVAAVAVLGIILLLPPLYHRLHQHQLLEHQARAELYRLVSERPGIHIEELARLTHCSRSTVVYHLRLLSRHGYVVTMGGRKSVHYYPNTGASDPAERERRALLTSPRARALAARIVAQPGLQRAPLAEQEGISVSTLSWHLGRLLRSGLVEDRLGPGGRELHPGPGLDMLLRPWNGPAAPQPQGLPPAEAPAATPT